MKILKRKIFSLIIPILVIIVLLNFTFYWGYLSKVIISGPLSISIEGIPSYNSKNIKIYGYSPTGKMQVFSETEDLNTWEYIDYSSFKSLCIFIPDSVGLYKKIVIITKNNRIEVTDLKNKISNNTIDLSGFIKGKVSKTEIIFAIFHWKEFKYLLQFLFTLIIITFTYFRIKKHKTALILFKNKYKIRYPSILVFIIIILGISFHFIFFVNTGKYLISSGIFLILLISLLGYAILRVIEKILKLKLKIKEIRLTIITVAICLCLLESLFILTGYKSTYNETRCRFFYSSVYVPEEKNWFHIWSSDHNLKTKEFCYHRTINSEGLSDKEHSIKKNINEYRIIGLGDSFTEGDGTDADSTWLKFLERSLSKYSFKKELTYMNAGVCGSDPCFEYILLKERLLKYNPDLVLLAVNNSDISDILLRGGMERFRPDGTLKYNPAPWWEPIYAMSHISRLFFSALGYNEQLYRGNLTDFKNEKRGIAELINKFDELSIIYDFKLIVVFHPMKEEILSQKLELDDVYRELKKNKKIETLDMFDYFNKCEKISPSNYAKYYWVKDGHHNAKGYAAFARGVEWKLKEMGIIDSLMKK